MASVADFCQIIAALQASIPNVRVNMRVDDKFGSPTVLVHLVGTAAGVTYNNQFCFSTTAPDLECVLSAEHAAIQFHLHYLRLTRPSMSVDERASAVTDLRSAWEKRASDAVSCPASKN